MEQVKCCNDTDCTHRMVKQSFLALKCGEWEEFNNTSRKEVKVSERAFDRTRKLSRRWQRMMQKKKLSIVREIMIRSTDYMRRIIAPAGRARRRYDVILVPALYQFPVGRLRLVSLRREKSTRLGGVRYVERNSIGCNRTGFWSSKQVKVLIRPRSSERMQYLRAFAEI